MGDFCESTLAQGRIAMTKSGRVSGELMWREELACSLSWYVLRTGTKHLPRYLASTQYPVPGTEYRPPYIGTYVDTQGTPRAV